MKWNGEKFRKLRWEECKIEVWNLIRANNHWDQTHHFWNCPPPLLKFTSTDGYCALLFVLTAESSMKAAKLSAMSPPRTFANFSHFLLEMAVCDKVSGYISKHLKLFNNVIPSPNLIVLFILQKTKFVRRHKTQFTLPWSQWLESASWNQWHTYYLSERNVMG